MYNKKEVYLMRKVRSAVLVLAVMVLLGNTVALAAYPNGTYIGKAEGNNGPIEVEVVVADGRIVSVEVLKSEETPIIGDTAFAEVSRAIVESQRIDVETVTGATFSSRALMNAVRNALADPGYKDGSYVVTTEGHNGPVTFDVVIAGGRLAKIDVLESEETPIISDTAFAEVSAAILAKQGTDVDTVTGATFSSRAMIAAVDKVLAAFEAEEELVLRDGTFVGTAQGMLAPIKVEVTVEQGQIVEIRVLEQRETPGLGDAAIKKLIPQIIEKQSIEVDAVSGATVSSNALVEAVKDALR